VSRRSSWECARSKTSAFLRAVERTDGRVFRARCGGVSVSARTIRQRRFAQATKTTTTTRRAAAAAAVEGTSGPRPACVCAHARPRSIETRRRRAAENEDSSSGMFPAGVDSDGNKSDWEGGGQWLRWRRGQASSVWTVRDVTWCSRRRLMTCRIERAASREERYS